MTRSHKAQSFVEFAIFLPIFLIMITGLTEFGFFLNQYLNVMDGPREGARWAADNNPLTDANFYNYTAAKAFYSTQPFRIDTHRDDIVISVFSVTTDQGTGVSTVTSRYPSPSGFSYYSHYTSRFTNAKIESLLNTGSTNIPPNTGVVLVEIFYNYSQLLKLPWITVFIPDPILMYTYTVMPCPAAEPH
jgi:hypothetical protein